MNTANLQENVHKRLSHEFATNGRSENGAGIQYMKKEFSLSLSNRIRSHLFGIVL